MSPTIEVETLGKVGLTRELVTKTVRYAREAIEEMLQQADTQPKHVQELEAYLAVAHAHV